VDACDDDRIVAAARPLRAASVTGVVSLIPCVRPHELVHIVAADREYVAAEMTAMLAYWLSELRCPVVNRATPGSLCGPAWRPERWCRLASKHGIPAEPHRRATRPGHPSQGDVSTLTVIGSQVIGPGLSRFAGRARAIASAAGVDLLQLWFATGRSGPRCIGAPPVPDIAAPAVQCAIVDYFRTQST
jgi:hypothetical protein